MIGYLRRRREAREAEQVELIKREVDLARQEERVKVKAMISELGEAFYGLGQYYYRASRATLDTSSAVWACVNLISSRVGAARWKVVQRKPDGGYEPKLNHPINMLLAQPSPRIPAYTFWRTMVEHLLTTGNAFALLGGKFMGYPTHLKLTVAGSVSIRAIAQTYAYWGTEPSPGGHGRPFTRYPNNIVHAMGQYYDPHTGLSISPIEHAARPSIDLLTTAQESAKQFMANQTKFSGTFETEIANTDTEQTQDYFNKMKADMAGYEHKGYTPFLPFGIKYKWPPAMQRDMQTAGDMDWAVSDIARVYGIPVPMIISSGPRPDVEQMEDSLMRDAILPVVHAMTGALARVVLNKEDRLAGCTIQADLRQYSGPTAGRAKKGLTEAHTGVIKINEIREGMGYRPVPEGDEFPKPVGASATGDEESGKDGDGDEKETTSEGEAEKDEPDKDNAKQNPDKV